MKKKLFAITISILAILGLFYLLRQSYAKYIKKIDGNVDTNVAVWNVLVNNESVLNRTSLTNSVIPVFPGNEYVNPNVIAPGVTGYFDIILDPNDTQVAFSYEVTAGENENIPDIKIIGYKINPTDDTTYEDYNENNPTLGYIGIDGEETTVRIFIKWIDENTTGEITEENTEKMNNKSDTEASTLNKIGYNINLRLIQKLED